MHERLIAWGLLVAVVMLTGCSSTAIPPTYTQGDVKAICERHNGWWHPNGLIEGYCEAFP